MYNRKTFFSNISNNYIDDLDELYTKKDRGNFNAVLFDFKEKKRDEYLIAKDLIIYAIIRPFNSLSFALQNAFKSAWESVLSDVLEKYEEYKFPDQGHSYPIRTNEKKIVIDINWNKLYDYIKNDVKN